MTLLDLLKKLYLMREIIQGSFNTQSNIFSYIQTYKYKESVFAFSTNFRYLFTRFHPFDKDDKNRLTTRFALYLDAFTQLHNGNLKPMLKFLEKHTDVHLFLNTNWRILERLYYEYKGKGKDAILLEEYSLLLNEDYQVIRIDLHNTQICNEPIRKESLYGFFQKIRAEKNPFFGKNEEEREQYIDTMSAFFSSYHI